MTTENVETQSDVIKVGSNLMELIEFIIYKKDNYGNIKKCKYGINVFKVREVIKSPEIIPLPNKMQYVDGMFNLRNENIVLINLNDRLGGIQRDYEENVVIVSEFNDMYIGLLVHEVVQIHRFSWERILPAPKMSMNNESGLIIGVVKLTQKESIIILDFESIVNEIDNYDSNENYNFNVSDNIKKINTKYTVLLADDSKTVRKQMNNMLKQLGFNTITTKNGKEALEKLNSLKVQAENEEIPLSDIVTVVITDIEMPQMDGYTLTKKIKNDEILSKIPVVMHTSLSGGNVKKKGIEVGADEYLTKFAPEKVKEVLFNLIDKWYN